MKKQITMLLTNGFDPDPRVYKEAVYLVRRGFTVTILCWDRDEGSQYPAHEVIDGIEIVRFRIVSEMGSGKKQLPAFFAYIRACRTYLKSHPCDYFDCNDIDGAIAWYLAKPSGKIPMVFDMHEYYEDVGEGHPVKQRIWRWLTIFMIRRSICAFYENDLYLTPPYSSVRDKLLPLKNYPDSDLLRPLPKTESDVFRIGYHGGVRSQTAEFTTLFEAVRDMEDVRVDIHGGGPDLPKLKELEKQYPNVHIHGPFNGITELAGLYANTDMVYAGYRPNALGHAVCEVGKFFECILTGTPMIMTEALTSMSSRIQKRGYGLICDTRDVEAVRAAVLKLKNDSEFWRQCADREKADAPQYDWQQAVKVLDQVYQL